MKAIDIMTRAVVTIPPQTTVAEAVRLMLRERISGLPVVGPSGTLVGIVTEGDFLRRAETGTEKHRPRLLEFLLGPGRLADDYVRSHGRRVDEVMTAKVTTIAEDTPVEAIVALMERQRIKRLPVVRGGKVVGIVSRANLLRAMAWAMTVEPAAAPDDAALRQRILAEFDAQHWVPRASLEVTVRASVVTLRGAITDDRERAALRVLVENVPGVAAVQDRLVWIDPASGWVCDAPHADAQDVVTGV